jgi:hypothetical protein
LNSAQLRLAKVSLFQERRQAYLASPSRQVAENPMGNWLKHFDQTALGMLFTDQHLSPSEVVRIARKEQCAEQAQCRAANANSQHDKLANPRLVGLR